MGDFATSVWVEREFEAAGLGPEERWALNGLCGPNFRSDDEAHHLSVICTTYSLIYPYCLIVCPDYLYMYSTCGNSNDATLKFLLHERITTQCSNTKTSIVRSVTKRAMKYIQLNVTANVLITAHQKNLT
jgi:hypothetical protein